MKSNNPELFWALSAILTGLLTACSSSDQSTTTATGCGVANTSCTDASGPTAIPTSSTTTIPLYIGDTSNTGNWVYANEPLVSVTICSPNHTSASQCQTISNILLDTGSFGLRVFASAIPSNVQLSQQTVNLGSETVPLAECAQFGIGADWGPVQKGDVILGNQTATNISMQVIDRNFASIPSGCAALCPDTDPCTTGFNGILGVGIFANDCGSACANYLDDKHNPGIYFGCDSTGCYDAYVGNCGTDQTCMAEVATSEQIANPVSYFASGANNGVALTLPSLAASGGARITGSMQLGIGTPSSVTVFEADPSGLSDGNGLDFTTTFEGTTYGGSSTTTASFLDSGSNAIYFPSSLTQCSDGSGFYCVNTSLNATIAGFNGTNSTGVAFSIANADSLFSGGNSAFLNLGGYFAGQFDWGLPFFYGKTVYVGLGGTTATINSSSVTGPYWAY